jgi:hypothetical protein
MAKYKFCLQIDNDSLVHATYELDLGVQERNNPITIFTPQKRQEMRRILENKSECRINDEKLEHMIKTWLLDIQEDYRETFMILNLPSLLLDNINNLQEQAYQNIPEICSPNITDIEPILGMSPPLNFC